MNSVLKESPGIPPLGSTSPGRAPPSPAAPCSSTPYGRHPPPLGSTSPGRAPPLPAAPCSSTLCGRQPPPLGSTSPGRAPPIPAAPCSSTPYGSHPPVPLTPYVGLHFARSAGCRTT
eukprot:882826-Prorocentrum_minimum.AAC.3